MSSQNFPLAAIVQPEHLHLKLISRRENFLKTRAATKLPQVPNVAIEKLRRPSLQIPISNVN